LVQKEEGLDFEGSQRKCPPWECLQLQETQNWKQAFADMYNQVLNFSSHIGTIVSD
jgi:hypothetical protein